MFQDIFRNVFKMSSKRLQDVFARHLQEVFRASSRRLDRRKIVTLRPCWRRLQGMSWRPANVCWVVSYTNCRISTSRYSEKLFHSAFQEFYTITRSSYLKAFIYLKSLKISCEEVIRNEVVTCQLASLWKELFHISTSPSCILLSFSKNASGSLLKKRLGKCASTISFRKYKQKLVLLVIC